MNLQSPVPVSFETERLIVRRYQSDDREQLFEAARSSIPEMFRFLPWCHPDYSIEDSDQWLGLVKKNWHEGAAFAFAIFDKAQEEFHGGCGINRIDEHPAGNLGYWIKTASTGKGYATEASRALARFGIRDAGFLRLEIIMSTENLASKGVAEGTGAVYEGTLRKRLMLHGKAHDAHLYSITADDLPL